MRVLSDFYKKTQTLHHAYLLEGDRDTVLAELFDFFKRRLAIVPYANPDVTVFSYDTLGIDDSRVLYNRASQKSFL